MLPPHIFKKGSLVFVFLHLLCHKQDAKTHVCWKLKGGIQGWCKWVCFHYMRVIMGMWCRVCTTCIKAVFACLCVCVSVFVCGLHMLPITSPICVNHHRRNRVRQSDYDLKDIREVGEPVTRPASLPHGQTSFTHVCSVRPAPHWLSCAAGHSHLLQITHMPRPLRPPFAPLLIDAVSHAI